MNCPKCNNNVSPTDRFCMKCGFNLEDYKNKNKVNSKKLCPECNTECFQDAPSCDNCGYPFRPKSINEKIKKNKWDWFLNDETLTTEEKTQKLNKAVEDGVINQYSAGKIYDLYIKPNVLKNEDATHISKTTYENQKADVANNSENIIATEESPSNIDENDGKGLSKKTIIVSIIFICALGFFAYFSYEQFYSSKNNEANIPKTDTTSANNKRASTVILDNNDSTPNTTAYLRNFISQYYSDMNSGNFDANKYFTKSVIQFINLKNTTPSQINEAIDKSKPEFLNAIAQFDSNTMNVSKTENGLDYYSYKVKYSCDRASLKKHEECDIWIEVGYDKAVNRFSTYSEKKIDNLQFLSIQSMTESKQINDLGKNPPINIGASFHGGLIAHIYDKGEQGYIEGETHGFIMASREIFSPSWYEAKRVCDTLTIDDYTHWLLPSQNELAIVYSNIKQLGGYSSGSHGVWTSTEYNQTNAIACSFDGGGGFISMPKSYGFYIRAIKYF